MKTRTVSVYVVKNYYKSTNVHMEIPESVPVGEEVDWLYKNKETALTDELADASFQAEEGVEIDLDEL